MEIDKPESSSGDIVHSVVRGVISAIPSAGGPAVELFNALIEPPLKRRKDKWIQEVTDAINELRMQGYLTIEELQNNEVFFTTLVRASQAALRTHQEEKLHALSNAVLNSALPDAPDDTLQQLFINLIEDFTAWHLRILNIFQSPDSVASTQNMIMGSLSSVLTTQFPELKDERELYDLIWRDLFARGLVDTDSLHTMMSSSGMAAKRTTDMGDQFLKFISTYQIPKEQ